MRSPLFSTIHNVQPLSPNILFNNEVIFIGLICKNAVWHAVVFEIGRGYTRELSILDIQDISYSFEKTIQTQDISIENYRQFLAPSE